MPRPERSEFLVFGAPVLGEGEIDEVTQAMRSGWVGTGPRVQAFERMLEEYLGAPHVRCVSSCTAALILAMKVAGVGPGDEVLVPAVTFVASANAVEHTGATPVLVDCDPRTGLIDPDAVLAAIGPKTKAVMPVHLTGRPVADELLRTLREEHGLIVVEDAAHAIGTEVGGRRVGGAGQLGIAAAFSFYVTKNITTIEGGAIATDDPEFAASIERLALHGLSLGAWQRYSDAGFKHYEVVQPGFKYNMTDVQAGIGLRQLPQLDGWIDDRARIWARYDELLEDLPLRVPAPAEPGTRHSRHLYQIELLPEAGVARDDVLSALTRAKIGSGVHYRPVHLHPWYAKTYGIAPSDLPGATQFGERTISLPLSPTLSEDDILDVVAALRAAVGMPEA